MTRNRRGGALWLAALVIGTMLAGAPAPGGRTDTAVPRTTTATTAAASAGGWQLRTSVKECALRAAGAALAGALAPMPLAVPLTLGLALAAVFTCF
jgi:hypothetical protein